jgi:hypothetical protein
VVLALGMTDKNDSLQRTISVAPTVCGRDIEQSMQANIFKTCQLTVGHLGLVFCLLQFVRRHAGIRKKLYKIESMGGLGKSLMRNVFKTGWARRLFPHGGGVLHAANRHGGIEAVFSVELVANSPHEEIDQAGESDRDRQG